MSSKKLQHGLVLVKCSVPGCNVHDSVLPGHTFTCDAAWHSKRKPGVSRPRHSVSGTITVRPQQRQ